MIDAHQYTAYLMLQGLADSTVRRYRSMYWRWVDYATAVQRDPWQPDPATAREWASTIHGSRSLHAQARGMMLHLCAALEVDDVSRAIPVPRQPGRSKITLDRAASSLLLEHSLSHGIAGFAVRVAFYTAARRSEIASMTWEGVDYQAGTLRFWRPKVRDWHTVPLHDDLAAELHDRDTGEQWLFPGAWGGHVTPTTIGQWISDVSSSSPVGRITPHVLRRTTITLVNDETGDLRAAMELAGHTDPRVTAQYTMVDTTRLRAVVRGLPSTPRHDQHAAA